MRKQVYQKRRTHIRSLLLFGTAICLLLAFLLRIDHAIRPNLCAVCESETKQFTAGLMADSIAEVLQDQQMKNVTMPPAMSPQWKPEQTRSIGCNLQSTATYSSIWNSAVMQNLKFLWELHLESGFLPDGVRMFLCGFCR